MRLRYLIRVALAFFFSVVLGQVENENDGGGFSIDIDIAEENKHLADIEHLVTTHTTNPTVQADVAALQVMSSSAGQEEEEEETSFGASFVNQIGAGKFPACVSAVPTPVIDSSLDETLASALSFAVPTSVHEGKPAAFFPFFFESVATTTTNTTAMIPLWVTDIPAVGSVVNEVLSVVDADLEGNDNATGTLGGFLPSSSSSPAYVKVKGNGTGFTAVGYHGSRASTKGAVGPTGIPTAFRGDATSMKMVAVGMAALMVGGGVVVEYLDCVVEVIS